MHSRGVPYLISHKGRIHRAPVCPFLFSSGLVNDTLISDFHIDSSLRQSLIRIEIPDGTRPMSWLPKLRKLWMNIKHSEEIKQGHFKIHLSSVCLVLEDSHRLERPNKCCQTVLLPHSKVPCWAKEINSCHQNLANHCCHEFAWACGLCQNNNSKSSKACMQGCACNKSIR